MPVVPQNAMVLAAGLGKRMRPVTNVLPKPMVPVGGERLITRALIKLQEAGIEKAVVNTHYMAELLEEYLLEWQKTHSQPKIAISREEVLLETGGGVAKSLPYLDDQPFYVINSDIMWLDGSESALLRLARHFDPETMDALLLIHPVEKAVGYDGRGDFDLLPSGGLQKNVEKTHFPYVYTGVQILSPRLFTDLPEGPFSLNVLYGRARAEDGRLKRICGLVHDGDWLHIGTPEGIGLAEKFLISASKGLT